MGLIDTYHPFLGGVLNRLLAQARAGVDLEKKELGDLTTEPNSQTY
jgi:hypothetical protein